MVDYKLRFEEERRKNRELREQAKETKKRLGQLAHAYSTDLTALRKTFEYNRERMEKEAKKTRESAKKLNEIRKSLGLDEFEFPW